MVKCVIYDYTHAFLLASNTSCLNSWSFWQATRVVSDSWDNKYQAWEVYPNMNLGGETDRCQGISEGKYMGIQYIVLINNP